MQQEPSRPTPREEGTLTDQERLDEAMIESFPASDPPSWNVGLSHEPAQLPEEALADKYPWVRDWSETKGSLAQKFPVLTADDLFYEEGREDELLARIEKKLGMSRDEVESILAECGGG